MGDGKPTAQAGWLSKRLDLLRKPFALFRIGN